MDQPRADLGPIIRYELPAGSPYTSGPMPEGMHSQIRDLTAGVIVLERLREQRLDRDLIWVLPWHILPGAVELYGIPVTHAQVEDPMLAHMFPFPRPWPAASPDLEG